MCNIKHDIYTYIGTETTVEDKEQLEQIEKRITNLENEVSAMEKSVVKEEESMVFIERMIECITLHNKKISFMIENIPSQLPIISDHYQLPSNALCAIIQYAQQQENISPLSSQYSNNNNNRDRNVKLKRKATSEMDDNPRANKRRRKNKDYSHRRNQTETPQIEIIGADEFDSVPKYVKGRLTQNRCNDAINEFNKELTSKYRILQMNPSKMQKYQFDLHERYIRQDTKETKNCYWLNHDDFKTSSTNFTFDQTGKAIFNVLRHLKRIRMISGKKPKYIVL